MSKIHSSSRTIDNKGTAAFSSYCASHVPQISWRPITNDDIGIDGEVELYDSESKPLAEIIKIQLKATESDKGYIKSDNPKTGTFIFYAEKSHVEYWQQIQNDVILVIYDNRNGADTLYAKKIENISLEKTGSTYIPILFNKAEDLLTTSKNDFLEKFSQKFNKQNPKIVEEKEGSEHLIANLVSIDFKSNPLFVAPIKIDRAEIIKKSWSTDKKLKNDASTRDVIRGYLYQNDLKCGSDWVLHNNKIITFWDLNSKGNSLYSIIDANSVEQFSPDEFCAISKDYRSVFKFLLKNCLGQILFKSNKFEWVNEEHLYRFKAPDKLSDKLTVKESWKGAVSAKRTVFKVSLSKKTSKFYCTHFAFYVDFKDFDGNWFVCLNPTWTVSIDGKTKSLLAHKEITRLKKLERNPSVFNHFRFVSYQLLFKDLYSYKYPFFEFSKLKFFTSTDIINDDSWLHNEDEEEANVLKDFEDPNINPNKNATPLFG